MSTEDFSELTRAEDIFLGALGFGEGARLSKIFLKDKAIELSGTFADGETFSAIFDEEVGALETWALDILKQAGLVETLR